MPPASPPRRPEPFTPQTTFNLRDDSILPGLEEVEDDEEDNMHASNDEDVFIQDDVE